MLRRVGHSDAADRAEEGRPQRRHCACRGQPAPPGTLVTPLAAGHHPMLAVSACCPADVEILEAALLSLSEVWEHHLRMHLSVAVAMIPSKLLPGRGCGTYRVSSSGCTLEPTSVHNLTTPDVWLQGAVITGPPTKVVLLRNMVGPGQVDEDLEDEVGIVQGRDLSCILQSLVSWGTHKYQHQHCRAFSEHLAHSALRLPHASCTQRNPTLPADLRFEYRQNACPSGHYHGGVQHAVVRPVGGVRDPRHWLTCAGGHGVHGQVRQGDGRGHLRGHAAGLPPGAGRPHLRRL